MNNNYFSEDQNLFILVAMCALQDDRKGANKSGMKSTKDYESREEFRNFVTELSILILRGKNLVPLLSLVNRL